jgi:hypothetical protein
MKISAISKNSILFTLGIILLVSCNDIKQEDFYMTTEVVSLKKVVNDTTMYALSFYVYSNYTLKSAEVTFPGSTNSPLALSPFENTSITFAREAGNNDFSKTAPATGRYNFVVQNMDGETYTDYDILTSDNLTVPTITGTVFNTNYNSMQVNWTKAQGAESYFVRLFDLNKELVYTGYAVDPDSTHYSIFPTDVGWKKSPVSATTYILQLNAVSYEDKSMAEYYYHVNSISFSEMQVAWNP